MRAAMVLAARREEFEKVLELRGEWWASLEAEGVDHVEAAFELAEKPSGEVVVEKIAEVTETEIATAVGDQLLARRFRIFSQVIGEHAPRIRRPQRGRQLDEATEERCGLPCVGALV